MALPLTYDVRFDRNVREGTAEYYSDWMEDGLYNGVMFFHDEQDYHRWQSGQYYFRAILKNTHPAPGPKYDKAERMQKRKHK